MRDVDETPIARSLERVLRRVSGGTSVWFVAFMMLTGVFAGACASRNDVHASPDAQARRCASCHLAAFESAVTPSHRGWSLGCATCHTTRAWSPAKFVHDWSLSNAHAGLACKACHPGQPAQFESSPTVCAGCHQRAADNAKVPRHDRTWNTCSTCHTTKAWRPATFVHSWPRDGAHAQAPCVSCHPGTRDYTDAKTACSDCHAADEAASVYPGHHAFPKTCADCHRTTSFRPALAPEHPEYKFSLKEGNHAAAGVSCLSCHRLDNGESKNGANTDCVDCHLGGHQRDRMDVIPGHAGNPSYPTESAKPNFCLQCHPRGRGT
jgi:hypothetical protein